jgi:BolA family transcriptional regulator, general stress-responsive regulator
MTPETELGPVGQTISAKLRQTFAPAALEVIDESHQHAGHAGAHEQGESHFRVRIVAEAFRGKSRVEQHRMVNAALAEEMRERVHALAIQASAPQASAPQAPAPQASAQQPELQLAFQIIEPGDQRVTALLSAAGLPAGDLDDAAFLGIVDGTGALLACAAMERCGDAVLIRSVAVAADRRRKNYGSTVVLKLLAEARNGGVQAAYLLTTSAQDFFSGLGFKPIDRTRVPAPIQRTSQFRGETCASATPMVQVLQPV